MSTFEVKGLDELLKKLNRLPETVGKKIIRQALIPAGEKLKAAIEAEAPVDRGVLKATAEVKNPKSKGGWTGVIVRAGGSEAPYAGPLEYGTKKMPANPFVRRAFDKAAPGLTEEIISEADKIIEEEMKK